MKPPQSYPFRSVYLRVRTKITPCYPFWLIYPRVRTKITQSDTHEPTLMSPTYSNATASICDLIIRYASNNFRFIILNPTQRTSKSAPRFLPEKQGRKCASIPMHILPQCHLGNPQVECQNIYEVNQYDTPLSHEYSIARHISSALKSIKVLNPITTKSQREKLNSSQQDREGKTPYDPTISTKPAIHQDRDISRTWETD